ncbi:MAG: amidohydrolase family protein [Spirochaetaceae bacterium]|nr:amidohydrolase family protein [Spirochaetaceae bacterium]
MIRRFDFPLLHDHHSHVSLYSALHGLPDLLGLDRRAAQALLASQPPDRLGIVTGWRTDAHPLPESELARLPPLIIVNSSLHGFALTPEALPFVRELWPDFYENSRDAAWGEKNLPQLFSFYARVAGLDSTKLAAFMDGLEAIGIGSAEDMTLTGPKALATILDSPYAERIRVWAAPSVYRGLGASERGACVGAKIFLDGSLGARSAALDRPFLSGEKGPLIYSDGELGSLLAEIASWKTGISIHAIGHRAIEQGLAALESLRADGIVFEAPRFEHVQFVDRAQARRFRDIGAVLSVQPNFNADSIDYADRLAPRHLEENDPFRMLIDEIGFVPGRDLIFGSDGMPHGPLEAFRCGLFPPFPSQRLTETELVAGYGAALGGLGRTLTLAVDDEKKIITPARD